MILEVEKLLRVGRFTLSLLEDRLWLRRRVETVAIETSETITRRISLDIDLGAVCRRLIATDHRWLFPDDRVPIPIGTLPKALFLNFDLTNGSGERLPLEPSSTDSLLATGAALAKLESVGFSMSRVSQPVLDHLKQIASAFPSDPMFGQSSRSPADNLDLSLTEGADATASDVVIWTEMLELSPFKRIVSNFALNYLPTIAVSPREGVQIIRYAFVESLRPPLGDVSMNQLVGVVWLGLIEAPALALSNSSHIRIIAPPGLMIEDTFLATRRGNLSQGRVHSLPESDRYYQRRIAQDRASIYASRLSDTENYLIVTVMRPERRGLLRQAQYLLTASALVLFAGAVLNFTTGRLGHGAIEACVVVILLLPSLMLALDAREGEHELVSSILRGVRARLAAASCVNVVAASVLAVGYTNYVLSVVWLVGAMVTCVFAIQLIRLNRVTAKAEEDTANFVWLTRRTQLQSFSAH